MVQNQIEKGSEIVTKTRLQKVSEQQLYLLVGTCSVQLSHDSHIGSFFFFFPEIESIENRQSHSCQFVQSCGFS